MGQERRCRVRVGRKVSDGKALLETEELLFRGDFHLAIPFREIASISAEDGDLRVAFPAGKAVFELGADAPKWLDRIRNPKSVLDKLGVKAEHTVALLGVFPEAFMAELKARARRVVTSKGLADADLLFLAAEGRPDLAQISRVAGSIQRNGTLWVVRPKGMDSITERDVLEAGKAAGFVDVKVVRFSETHTAEKFVVPVARR